MTPEMATIVRYLIAIFLGVFVTSIIAPVAQLRFDGIKPDYYKKVKIKRFGFLFRGLGLKGNKKHNDEHYKSYNKYADVKNYGVILPMFVVQLLGYILSLSFLIASLLLLFVYDNAEIIPYLAMGFGFGQAILTMIVHGICSI